MVVKAETGRTKDVLRGTLTPIAIAKWVNSAFVSAIPPVTPRNRCGPGVPFFITAWSRTGALAHCRIPPSFRRILPPGMSPVADLPTAFFPLGRKSQRKS